ncbi:MAG: VTT domain-containing protein, partial [Candidatus Promineifilaceae bacterium]|nr:VTT domain-containing protein [Candidatus Promineifilaceae bacterium]
SLAGSLGAALLGYGLGVSGGRLMERFIPEEEQEKAQRLLQQRGMLAVIISRPIPILAETVAIVAGLSGMKLPRFTLAALIGTLPIVFVYALTGAAAADFDNGLLVFGLVLLAAGLFWLGGHALKKVLPALEQTSEV